MEPENQKSNLVDEWLQSEKRLAGDRRIVFDFAIFCGKSPKQITEEFSVNTSEQFADYYGKQLLLYTAQLQKKLPSNIVRDQVNAIRSFFKYSKLPIKFGFSAHIQFFFK
jgi:hypothetical protein